MDVWRRRNAFCFFLAIICNNFFFNAFAWPDGAPCIFAVLDSMNPLEAVEHQGGLQMSVPPFIIEPEENCYWRNQPIAFTLRGNSTKDFFKGFAIQPLAYRGGIRVNQRVGQFLRLDDNGSWQQQCFRRRDSVTHSHDEKKNRIKLWWKNNEDEQQHVQFVATVVVSLRKFWVKSVLSPPLAPCRTHGSNDLGWQRDPVTVPPPVSSFKMDTFHIFNRDGSANTLEQSFVNVPEKQELGFRPSQSFFTSSQSQSQPVFVQPQPTLPPPVIAVTAPPPPPPTTSAITTTTEEPNRQRLTHVIPLPKMQVNRRPQSSSFNTAQQSQQFRQQQALSAFAEAQRRRQQQFFQQQQQQQTRGFTPTIVRTTQPTFFFQPQQQLRPNGFGGSRNVCRDVDSAQQCFGWISFCGSSAYMRNFCRQTCRLC